MAGDLIDAIRAEVAREENPRQKALVAGDFLQTRILASLARCEEFRSAVFLGGSALRIVARLPRFSENLDFSQEQPGAGDGFIPSLRRLDSDLKGWGLSPEVRAKTTSNVNAAKISFPALPARLGVPVDPRSSMMIKIELDTNPPAGASVKVTRVTRFGDTFRVRHHDLATMFAGKLHALLARAHDKGRDFYDLAWYLERDVEPNVAYLDAALVQTGHRPVGSGRWRRRVLARIKGANWTLVRQDITRFAAVDDPLADGLTLEFLSASLATRR